MVVSPKENGIGRKLCGARRGCCGGFGGGYGREETGATGLIYTGEWVEVEIGPRARFPLFSFSVFILFSIFRM